MTNPRPEPDGLQSALAAGEESAFHELLNDLGPRLHRAAIRMLGSRADADDAVQEVFVSLVKSRKSLRAIENMSAYTFVVLHRTVGRMIKDRQRKPASLDCTDDCPSPSPRSSNVDEELLNRAVRSLPVEQREVVVLKTDGGLTFAEIGRVLGVNSNTVASRYRYALDKLREELKAKSC